MHISKINNKLLGMYILNLEIRSLIKSDNREFQSYKVMLNEEKLIKLFYRCWKLSFPVLRN